MDVPEDDLAFAYQRITRSRANLDAKNQQRNNKADDFFGENPGHAVREIHTSIELSVKSILNSAGISSPNTHDIDLNHDHITGLVYNNDNIPDELHQDIMRAIFLTNPWDQYYNMARYGEEEMNVPAKAFMSLSDVDRALDDAEFCVDTASSFHHYQMRQNGYEISDLDII